MNVVKSLECEYSVLVIILGEFVELIKQLDVRDCFNKNK